MKTTTLAILALALATAGPATHAADLGKPGEPIKLTVGYQPYDTISYSAVVIRATNLWKKNLPAGSEVEFQNALQGSLIVNQMLANKQQIGYLGDMPAVDAAVLWEPSVSRIGDIVGEKAGRIVATGHTFGISDAGAIAMREDLIKQRPDIVEAWLKTELEAQQFVVEPKNWNKVAEYVKGQTVGISIPMAWFSIYGAIPPGAGGSAVRDEKPFVFDPRVQKLLAETYVYLREIKAIDVDKPAAGALDDSFARRVAQTAKVSLPLGTIKAQNISKAPR